MFLEEIGLNLKQSKTRLLKCTESFDFLGWHFKVKAKNGKAVSYPSKKNRRNMIDTIKQTMKDKKFSLEERLNKIKVIYRGWRNYQQFCDMSQVNLWSINK